MNRLFSPQLHQKLLRPVGANLPLGHKGGGEAVHLVGTGAGGDGDLTCVEGHVPPLDAIGRQRADCGQVLRQTDRDDHFSQFAGGGNTH